MQLGFLSFESAREQICINISCWNNLGTIPDWTGYADQLFTQKKEEGVLQMV